jgi:hypothetical protein
MIPSSAATYLVHVKVLDDGIETGVQIIEEVDHLDAAEIKEIDKTPRQGRGIGLPAGVSIQPRGP